jgi:hypothetical protein
LTCGGAGAPHGNVFFARAIQAVQKPSIARLLCNRVQIKEEGIKNNSINNYRYY